MPAEGGSVGPLWRFRSLLLLRDLFAFRWMLPRMQANKRAFIAIAGFPGVVGVIDGTHVHICDSCLAGNLNVWPTSLTWFTRTNACETALTLELLTLVARA